MPSYQSTTINRNVQQASPGLPAYLLGSLNRLVATTRMNITNVALTSNVATLTVAVIEGNLPTVGQLVSTTGVSNSIFNNLKNLSITAVSFTNSPEDGKGTISFALTHADVVSVAATGYAEAPQVEIGETIANGASSAVALQANTGPENGRAVRCDIIFPTLPTTLRVDLQAADVDVDAAYVTIGTPATVAASTQSGQALYFDGVRANFLRYNLTTLAGSGKIVAKITV